MHTAERVGDHELGTQQPDTVDRQGSDFLGTVGDGQVHVEPRARAVRGGAGGARRLARDATGGAATLATWSPS